MGWDRKKRGPAGYYYKSVRVPGKPYPVKVYCGRKTAGNLAAAAVEHRRQDRVAAQKIIQEEWQATAEADRLAAELTAWAELLSSVWLVMAGHHCRRGEWRRRHG
jgi:hypothetical protein